MSTWLDRWDWRCADRLRLLVESLQVLIFVRAGTRADFFDE